MFYVALRQNGVLHYLHGDHLLSTALTTNSSGATSGDHRYYAYGRYRGGGELPTEQNFTSQKLDASGLIYYNSRYYDPELGAFLSPDTLVPDPTTLFDYNRYMYVRGNPLLYNDPTGHQSACMAMPPSPITAPLIMGCRIGEMAMRYGPTVIQLASQWADKLPAVDWLFSSSSAEQGAHSAGQQNAGNSNTGNPNGFDPNNFDPNKNKDLIKELGKVIKRYPLESGKCSICATKTYEVFTKAGYNAEIVRFEYGENIAANAMLKANGEVIATTRGATLAYHEFVRVGSRVFDTITGPTGMLWDDYLKLWDPETLRLVTQVVVKSSQQ